MHHATGQRLRSRDKFATLNLLRTAESPLLSVSSLARATKRAIPRAAQNAVDALMSLLENDPAVTFLAVLQCIADHGLFDIPTSLRPFITIEPHPEIDANDTQTEEEEPDEEEALPSNLEAASLSGNTLQPNHSVCGICS